MLSVTSHRGFLQEAQQRSRQHCAQLRNSRALTCEVKQALRRGDLQGAVRLLKEGQGERLRETSGTSGTRETSGCGLREASVCCPPSSPVLCSLTLQTSV